MKMMTAISERLDLRPKPHTPWPLVHPDPSTVPKPTMNPAGIKTSTSRDAADAADPADAGQQDPARQTDEHATRQGLRVTIHTGPPKF